MKSLDQTAHEQRMYEQREAHLGHLPGHILLDLARNEAASREWRKAATEFLIDKHFPQANHPDLAVLVMEIQGERAARQDVQDVVESAIEAPFCDVHTGGAPSASVTTDSLQQPDIIRNAEFLSDDALAETFKENPSGLPGEWR